jgi:hypothetical protein
MGKVRGVYPVASKDQEYNLSGMEMNVKGYGEQEAEDCEESAACAGEKSPLVLDIRWRFPKNAKT